MMMKEKDLEIFLGAPEIEAELPSYLDQACGEDAELRRRVESLLAADRTEWSPVDHSPVGEAMASEAPTTEVEGTMIGHYLLLQEIGKGGFGAVWAAEQQEPIKRRVALKIIKLGMDTKEVIARFEAERQALALMDHPNIAKVFDAGATESGRPYFVMELVKGIPITEYCDKEKLTTDERLDLFIKVCHAVQHAHQKGIIHRDIKASNILVTSLDGVPVPKVIDFGIAKATQQELTEQTVYTKFHQFIGTPSYMSPEQVAMASSDIDTRTDIYSLGVLLYELLTETTPFDSKELLASGIDQMRNIIREKEPQRPSKKVETLAKTVQTEAAVYRSVAPSELVSKLRDDLDWIVMKCLEKERSRRYETANSLAEDLGRHLDHEPITARPPSTVYRMQKSWQRNKVVFTAGAAAALALVFGIAIASWQAMEAKRERNNAVEAQGRLEESTVQLQHNLARQHLHLGRSLCERGKVAPGLHWMVRAIEEAPPGSEGSGARR